MHDTKDVHYGMTVEEIATQWKEISAMPSEPSTVMRENAYVTDPKEVALFKAYEAEYMTCKLHTYRTEWNIYDESLQYCDTFYEHIDEKDIVMDDWETSKKVNRCNNYQSGSLPYKEDIV